MKKLVYRIEIVVSPQDVDVKAMLAALQPFGEAEIVQTSMRNIPAK